MLYDVFDIMTFINVLVIEVSLLMEGKF